MTGTRQSSRCSPSRLSIVGTAAALLMFGFSISALSLFGLVLAIGIVVDDAILVNAQRHHAEYDRVVALLFPLPGPQIPSSLM
jgi:predicted exporter